MQKIILFIEPNEDAYNTPVKIGNLCMNIFTIDEDASFEIKNIFELVKTSVKNYRGYIVNYDTIDYTTAIHSDFTTERYQKGMDHLVVTRHYLRKKL